MTATITREPMTYEAHKRDSYFVDLARTSLRKSDRESIEARARLQRHSEEMDVERRVNPRATDGQGGEFDSPLWAIDQFATVARAGRVIADLVPNLFLPEGYDSVHIPIMSTGASDVIQADQTASVSSTDQVTTDVPNTSIVTVAGQVDASQQLFDRTPAPGYDGIVLTDLARAYNETLEKQLTFGSGVNGQLTGVTQVTGRQTDIAGSGTSVVQATGVATLKPLVGQAMAAIGNNRKLPADALVIAPRRFAWIASDISEQPQTQTWPLPGAQSVGAGQTAPTVAQAFAGLPTYQSAACMSGAITATDVAIALRCEDALLYESAPHFRAVENPLSGTLRVRLQLYRYVAFPIRKPGGICVVTALPAPTAFGA